MFRFYNTCLNSFNISSIFSGGIIISAKFLGFLSVTCFFFSQFCCRTTELLRWRFYFLKTRFFYGLLIYKPFLQNIGLYPITDYLYLLDKFVANNINPYPLTYFLDLGPIEHRVISIYQSAT